MKIYLVSYDLRTPGKDYTTLWTAIQGYVDCCRALASQWLICADATAEEVRTHLLGFIDKNDCLFVSEVNLNHAGRLDEPVVKWLRSALHRMYLQG